MIPEKKTIVEGSSQPVQSGRDVDSEMEGLSILTRCFTKPDISPQERYLVFDEIQRILKERKSSSSTTEKP